MIEGNVNEQSPLDNVTVVLVRPIYGGNIGSVCRAANNMGVSRLVLVSPQDPDIEEARKMACWAQDTLDSAVTVDSLEKAIRNCSMVCGATARLGLYRRHSRTPREAVTEILSTAANGEVALVFGPEDNGLSNEDIALCTHLIQIPSTPAYTSLNLAQAVMICLYEIYIASGEFVASEEKSPPANAALRERMFEIWEKVLLDIGFMKEDKAPHMMLGIRRLMARGAITEDDVRIVMGIVKQTQWCADRMKELETQIRQSASTETDAADEEKPTKNANR